VLYGAAEFSRDLDLALLPDPANLGRLETLLIRIWQILCRRQLAEEKDTVRPCRVSVVRRLREIEPEVPGAVQLLRRHVPEVQVVVTQ